MTLLIWLVLHSVAEVFMAQRRYSLCVSNHLIITSDKIVNVVKWNFVWHLGKTILKGCFFFIYGRQTFVTNPEQSSWTSFTAKAQMAYNGVELTDVHFNLIYFVVIPLHTVSQCRTHLGWWTAWHWQWFRPRCSHRHIRRCFHHVALGGAGFWVRRRHPRQIQWSRR